jgi:hypothetical protein
VQRPVGGDADPLALDARRVHAVAEGGNRPARTVGR